jgi:branched-chain amino acid transport system ATP-binding protein
MTGELALRLDGVTAGYGNGDILHGVSLEVRRGEVTALLGANGAGKSTTLRAISGVISARGTIEVNGESIRGLSTEGVAMKKVAHVPEGRGTFPRMTVEENLRVGGLLQPRTAINGLLQQWYDFFPRLKERSNDRAGNLSGGEQQMLAIARALMMRPDVLLLDEPSTGLAPMITVSLFEQLKRLNREQGIAMLIVEQNANLALNIATTAYVLESGRIAVSGEASALAEDPRVRRAYLHV